MTDLMLPVGTQVVTRGGERFSGRGVDADLAFRRAEYERLRGELEVTFQASRLPGAPSARAALSDFLVRFPQSKGKRSSR